MKLEFPTHNRTIHVTAWTQKYFPISFSFEVEFSIHDTNVPLLQKKIHRVHKIYPKQQQNIIELLYELINEHLNIIK